MAEQAAGQSELLFCVKCKKETQTLPAQKVCSVCGMSRRWNAFFHRTNIPFEVIAERIEAFRGVIIALTALIVALVAAFAFWPKSAHTNEIAIVKGCDPPGECLTVELQNTGTKEDRLLALDMRVLIKDNAGKILVDQPVKDHVPDRLALLDTDISKIPINDTWIQKFERKQFGDYFAEPHHLESGISCIYIVNAKTSSQPKIKGSGSCW